MKYSFFIFALFLLFGCKSAQRAIIQSDSKYGLINRKGEIVVEPQYDFILKSNRINRFMVKSGEKYGFINNNGQVVIPFIYEDVNPYYERLAAVKKNGKYGFINHKGKVKIPFLYDDVFLGFSKGISDVTINDTSGYINKRGKVVIPLKFETCYPFLSDLAHVVTFELESYLTDKKGTLIKYDKKLHEYKRLWVPLNSYPGSVRTKTGRGRRSRKGGAIMAPVWS